MQRSERSSSTRLNRIDDILRRLGWLGCDQTVSAGRDICLQSSYESRHLHRAGHFADPHVHAGFEFIEMTLHTKARLFHEVGREKTVHGGHDPWMFLDVAVTEPELGDRDVLSGFHPASIRPFVERILPGYGTSPGGLRTPV